MAGRSAAPPLFPAEATPRALSGFEILQRLGAGGAGEVFLARSRAGKLVAIKTLGDTSRDAHEGETADAFLREASVCVRLRHPGIVQVRAFLEDEGVAAIVFDYIPGVALARVLRLCQSAGARLPDNSAWHVVARVAEALAYAHGFSDGDKRTPIVHRDVSPANVLVDWQGAVKLADFGLAKVLGVSPGTRVGIVKGTLGCMSPEQARGDPVDERSDVYSAGLLAWRLATGRVPFGRHHRDEWELLRAMRTPRIPPLSSLRPDLPRPLLDAVDGALVVEASERTLSAGALARAVRDVVDLEAGQRELGRILRASRGTLERAVKRVPADASRASASPSPSHDHTLRYEEVALAFNHEPEADAPTIETFALPSDPSVLAALPATGDEPPPGPPEAAAQPFDVHEVHEVHEVPELQDARPAPATEVAAVRVLRRSRPGTRWAVLSVGALVAAALVALLER